MKRQKAVVGFLNRQFFERVFVGASRRYKFFMKMLTWRNDRHMGEF